MIREELLALADELEGMDCRIREVVAHDACEDTTVSAYDLLPEEDLKALAWVREHGGLAAVEKRLMPDGMEWLLDVWPRWSNGEYCKFGDWWKAGEYGEREPQQLSRLTFFTPEQLREWGQDEGENFGYAWDCMRPSDTTYRPDKVEPPAPKVLDADGVEIRVGDVLYSIETGDSVTVGIIEPGNPWFAKTDGALQHCAKFTHRAPVLAADGEPLEVGQTVWHDDGEMLEVLYLRPDGLVDCCGEIERPERLTHERPVLDADGNHIEPAMDVWWICEGDELGIHAEKLHVESIGEDGFVECSPFNGGTWVELDSTELYVHKPVLDADGEPIREGDTVYVLGFGEPLTVKGFADDGRVLMSFHGENSLGYKPSKLTHEQPDTWERLEEDARQLDIYLNDTTDDYPRMSCCRELVRRCRALADRERGA